MQHRCRLHLRRVAAACAGVGLAGSALAQEQVFRSVDAVAAKQVRLAMVGNITKECTPGPTPEVKVVTPPKNGTLALRTGKTKAGALARCPKLEAPAQALFYQANPKFNGSDEVVYEVKRADGRNQSVTVKINVGDQAKPAAKPQDGTDL